MNKYPTEVTVIVNSVQNIKPKKKDLKYCVFFSVGSVKFRSDPIQDPSNNPQFNTESALQIENPNLQLTLVVCDKKEKEFYGQLVIPLSEISHSRGVHALSSLLQPHKKCPAPTATIRYEVWISKTLLTSEMVVSVQKKGHKTPLKAFKKTLSAFKMSPLLSRKNKQFTGGGMKQAHSSIDIYNNNNKNNYLFKDRIFNEDNISRLSYESNDLNFNVNKNIKNDWDNQQNDNTIDRNNKNNNNNNNNEINSTNTLKTLQPSLSKSYNCLDDLKSSSSSPKDGCPEISGISPNCGIITGGTKIVIRGSCLGTCKEDIIGLFICGSNVLSSLVYHNACKISCVSKSWKLCSGPVSIETQSGGKHVSDLKFTYKCDEESEFDTNSVKRADSLNASNKSKSSTNLKGQLTPPGKKPFNLANKLSLGLSKSFLSRSLMNLNDGADIKEARSDDSSNFLTVNDYPYGQSKSSTLELRSSSKPPNPPVLHVPPFMVDREQGKNKDTVKVNSKELKGLEQQLFTWQKCANNLTAKTKELEDENERLKSYIDKVVSYALVKCPEILSRDNFKMASI